MNKPGYYVFRDGVPIAGPFKTDQAACKSIAKVRDPELLTVDLIDDIRKLNDEKQRSRDIQLIIERSENNG